MAARKHLVLENIELTHIDGWPLPGGVPGKAIVRFQPRLRFSLDFDRFPPLWHLEGGKVYRIRTGTGVEADGYFQEYPLPGVADEPVSNASFALRKAPHIVISPAAKIKKLDFRMVNFPRFLGKDTKVARRKTGVFHFGAATGRFRGFRFDITERVGRTGDPPRRPLQGYALTHNGVLRREDGKTFSVEEAQENMRRLRAFLSFLRGWMCTLIPIRAVTGNGNAAFWWGVHYVEPEKPGGENWFSPAHGSEIIANLLGPFDELWEQWGKALLLVIDLYVNAAAASAHVAVILTQAAWETLGYQIVGRGRGAESRLSRTLKKLGIDASLPSECPTLQSAFPKHKGPAVLTKIRDDLVHPEEKCPPNLSTMAHFEARNLGLWYVEMILLKQLGFSGQYHDRIQQKRLTM